MEDIFPVLIELVFEVPPDLYNLPPMAHHTSAHKPAYNVSMPLRSLVTHTIAPTGPYTPTSRPLYHLFNRVWRTQKDPRWELDASGTLQPGQQHQGWGLEHS